jgi:hypothetical protein
MKITCVLVGAVLLAITACSNPLPFGPGRVEIKLDQAFIRAVPHEVLFPGSLRDRDVPKQRNAVVLVISSQTELLSYFKRQDRQLQVRCAVEGNSSNRTYQGFALDPVPEHTFRSNSASQSLYRYTIYSFIDLEADDVAYERGKPATGLDLKTASFASLKCHLLGVIAAPALFPRSNDVVVTASTFRDLLHEANIR